MSVLNKDDVIKACADAYRTASGTTDSVPVGQLGELISALTAGGGSGTSGAALLESGEITTIEETSSASTLVVLSQIPDLFMLYAIEDSADKTRGATVGCLYINADKLKHIVPSTTNVTNVNLSLIRVANTGVYNGAYNIINSFVEMLQDGTIQARFHPRSSGYPIHPNTYRWESYKFWSEVVE